MASEKIIEKKKQIVADLVERLQGSVAGVIVDYKGITVEEDTKLRRDLREAGVKYEVIKNAYLRRAVQEAGLASLEEKFVGTTALATSTEDHVAAARILVKFSEANNKFTVKGGFLDGEQISEDKLISLSKLPTLDILLATVASTMNAPIAKLARAFQAVADKKAEEGGEAAVEEEAKAEEPKEEAVEAEAKVEEVKEEVVEEAKEEVAEEAKEEKAEETEEK